MLLQVNSKHTFAKGCWH